MAGSRTPKCLLGVLDEQINVQNDEHVDWTINKIGGTPDWIHVEMRTPLCRLCSRELPLIVQAYCPLDGSPYHRTLYVFACVNKQCWNNPDSWIVLRSQKLVESVSTSDLTVCDAQDTQSDYWLENADDWGEDNGNENFGWDTYKMSVESVDNQRSRRSKRSTPVSSESKPDVYNLRETVTDADGNTVLDNSMDGQNQNIISQDETYRQNLERIRNLQLHEQGNGVAVEGAVGVDPVDEATAEVESPDEGTITIESPIAPTPETVATLFSEQKALPNSPSSSVLKSWFVCVVEEPSSECLASGQFTEHERELLMQYQKKEGLNFNELFNRSLLNNDAQISAGEVYEKTVPKHGDILFHKMLTRLQLCPQQILRYARDPESQPMFISPPSADALHPGKCEHCGEHRRFEFQFLPSLVDCLRVEGVDDPIVEFGTVLLYTCKASCWTEGDRYREEKLILQSDPDFSYFAALAQHHPI